MSLTTLKDKVEQLIEKAQSGDGKPEQEKSVDIVKNGTTEVLPDKGNTLSKVLINVEVPTAGGTEELGTLIDQSGVLGTTDETVTVTEKVEQLIHATDLFFKLYGIHFYGKNDVERIKFYIDWVSTVNFEFARGLKFLRGVDATRLITCRNIFNSCSALETIEIPFDMSKHNAYHMAGMFGGCISLVNVRFVKETIKDSITIPSPVLSAESIQSIIDGLAVLVVGATRTLTLHADAKIMQSQVDSANAKGWTIAGGTVVSEEEYYG